MNHIVLLGRLTRDPEVRYTTTSKVVTSFTLAVNRTYKTADGKTEADFIQCQAWGKLAEAIGNNVQKGQRLLVSGRLQIRSYDAKDGSKRYTAEVICDNSEFIEPKPKNNTQHKNNNVQSEAQYQNSNGFESYCSAVPFAEEIPF